MKLNSRCNRIKFNNKPKTNNKMKLSGRCNHIKFNNNNSMVSHPKLFSIPSTFLYTS